MKNFDEVREERAKLDRSFQIGGETFTRKLSVAPETILGWTTALTGERAPTEEEWIGICDETMLALLEPGQQEKWEKVRAIDAEYPLSIQDISGAIMWALGEIAGRPTGAPSGSSDGRDTTGTILRDASSSQEAPAASGS